MSILLDRSNQQMLLTSAVYGAAGASLIRNPVDFLDSLRPVLAFVEKQTGLPPYRGGAGSGQVLVMMGLLLLYLGEL